jgi:hypothetical protein
MGVSSVRAFGAKAQVRQPLAEAAAQRALERLERVVEDDGTEWAAVRPGRVVRLSFTPPDGGPALEALALLVREGPEGAIYFFADLNAPAVSRLSTLIARLPST